MFREQATGQVKTEAQIRRENPNTSFPKPLKAEHLDGYDVVLPAPKPAPSTNLKVVVKSDPVQDANGNWVHSWEEVDRFASQEEIDAFLLSFKAQKSEEVRTGASYRRDKGTSVNGLEISTSSSARSLLIGGKQNPKATRKVVTKGGRMEVSQAEFDAIVDAVAEYIQAVIDREYDLLEAVDAAATVQEVEAIDVGSGWPT